MRHSSRAAAVAWRRSHDDATWRPSRVAALSRVAAVTVSQSGGGSPHLCKAWQLSCGGTGWGVLWNLLQLEVEKDEVDEVPESVLLLYVRERALKSERGMRGADVD
jgi:hypothetical protein